MRIVPRPPETRTANAQFYRDIRKHDPKRARTVWRIFRDADYKLLANMAEFIKAKEAVGK